MTRSVMIAGACFFAVSAIAADVGAFRPSSEMYSLSLTYEQYKRDVTQDVADIWDGEEFDGEQKENHTLLRFVSKPTPFWGFMLGVGVADADASENIVPMLGLGAHYVFYVRNSVSASVFGQVHHISGIEYENLHRGVFRDHPIGGSGYGSVAYSRTESYFEYETGLEIVKDIFTPSGGRCSLYGGFMLSFLQSDGEEDYGFYDHTGKLLGRVREDGLDFEAESPEVLFAGMDFAVPGERFGMRFEARILKQTSLSFSAYGTF